MSRPRHPALTAARAAEAERREAARADAPKHNVGCECSDECSFLNFRRRVLARRAAKKERAA